MTMKSTIYLDVPYEEKDIVKALGAKWSVGRRQWFVPADVDSGPFAKWIRRQLESVLIAPVWISKSTEVCWKCEALSPVYCLTASAVVDVYYDEAGRGETFIPGPVFIKDLVYADEDLISNFRALAPGYFQDYSKMQEARLFMNHCERCRSKLGDFYLHNEPGSAFHPMATQEESPLTRIPLCATGRFLFDGSFSVDSN